MAVVRRVRQIVKFMLRQIHQAYYYEIARFLQTRVKVIKCAGSKLHDMLGSHISCARDFTLEHLRDTPSEWKLHYDMRADVVKQDQYWHILIPDWSDKIKHDIIDVLKSCLVPVHIDHFMNGCTDMIEGCDWRLGQPADIRNYIDVQLPQQDHISIVLDRIQDRWYFPIKLDILRDWRKAT